MGIWALLTGAQTANKSLDLAKTGLESVTGMFDALHYSKEEKGAASLALTTAAIRMVEATHGESTTRSITRRILAWAIMGSFLFLLLFGTLVYKWDAEWSAYCLNSAKALTFLATPVGIFYFGYYGIKAVRGK